jgi:hypothetical protein
MEAAIRWSPHSTQQNPRFLIIDVALNRLRLCQIDRFEKKNKIKYRQLCVRDKLPNYTAFDWSKRDEHIVAIGSASGEAVIVQVDADHPQIDYIHSFPIKHQRKCNSIAFSSKNFLATGLDRVRNDVCLNVYDLNTQNLSSSAEPYKKLASSEAISSIKFFTGQPDTLVAGVSRQCIRIYDLRGKLGMPTCLTHNLTALRFWHCWCSSISNSSGAQHSHRSLGRELFHLCGNNRRPHRNCMGSTFRKAKIK